MTHIPAISINNVRRALALPAFDTAAAEQNMAPNPRGILPQNRDKPPREAGVLALLYPEVNNHPRGDGLHIVLTRRTEHLRGHSGQISFPGGRRDPEDASFKATALRETCEELGICNGIEVVGTLSTFYIPPSHYNVHPCVGILAHKPTFKPNPHEVAEVFSFALRDLLDDTFKGHESRTFNNMRVQIPFYTVNAHNSKMTHKVWGATAVMLSELECRLRDVLELNE